MSKWGTYAWTASAAGWAVLYYITELPEALACAIGCGLMAAIWGGLQK